MRLCVPTHGDEGRHARVSGHFGRGALDRLQARGVRVLQTQALTVAGVIEEMRLVESIVMDVEKSCSGQGPHRHRRGRRSPR